MKIAIGSDHAGFELKEKIQQYLKSKKIEVADYGCHDMNSVDYPDVIHPVASEVSNGSFPLGIILCGSGNGAAMTANKHKNVRCALCWNTELAELSRKHNNANILSIPARFVSENIAMNMIDAFLFTEFEGGRHQNRVNKIEL
ncbi:MAG: ribose 5-phosphate isomerase B [Saprospiraceae bacterium]|nr:ribose 5-phosphate isomerase B [Saprospiraceae bacterium]